MIVLKSFYPQITVLLDIYLEDRHEKQAPYPDRKNRIKRRHRGAVIFDGIERLRIQLDRRRYKLSEFLCILSVIVKIDSQRILQLRLDID